MKMEDEADEENQSGGQAIEANRGTNQSQSQQVSGANVQVDRERGREEERELEDEMAKSALVIESKLTKIKSRGRESEEIVDDREWRSRKKRKE